MPPDPKLAEIAQLTERRQALFDEWYVLNRKPEPRNPAAARQLRADMQTRERRMNLIDKRLNEISTKKNNNWRTDVSYRP